MHLPHYVYIREGEQEWISKGILDKKVYTSKLCKNKKLAKQDVAEQIYKDIKKESSIHITDKTVLLIDGDQRHDVIKWLESSIVTWDGLEIVVYVSPTSTLHSKNFTTRTSKTTNRDSADALLLMDLGMRIHADPEQKIVIVSSDHILVQAAQDHDLGWAKDLNHLKTLLLQ